MEGGRQAFFRTQLNPPETHQCDKRPHPRAAGTGEEVILPVFWRAYPKTRAQGQTFARWVLRPYREIVVRIFGKVRRRRACSHKRTVGFGRRRLTFDSKQIVRPTRHPTPEPPSSVGADGCPPKLGWPSVGGLNTPSPRGWRDPVGEESVTDKNSCLQTLDKIGILCYYSV